MNWLMAGDLRDPHTPNDVSCTGVASAVLESLVQRESDQMVSAPSMLRMTMLEEAVQVGIELHFHLPWLHSVCCLL